MLKAPCKDCTDRDVGCHSVCEKYKAFDKERKEFLAMRSAILQEEYAYIQATMKRNRRKRRK